MRVVKLMADDYECFPLWEASSGMVGDIDPKSLPISSELSADLLSWADRFDQTLNEQDPANSGFPSPKEESDFKAAGHALAAHLAKELEGVCKVMVRI